MPDRGTEHAPRRGFSVRRPAVALGAAVLVLALIATGAALVATSSKGSGAAAAAYRLGADGTTAAIDSYQAAIRETTWVDIGRDDDGDGIADRVAVDIIRPAEAAAAHERVPVIMETSGYYGTDGRGNEMQDKAYDAHGGPTRFPLFYDNYFVPRGYAVALVDLAGVNRSTGCPDYGGPSELASSTRVIDWLNGRAPGYGAPRGGARKAAGWASGAVGMIGKSWDGQNVVETSVTGIRGLDAVVPLSAPTSDWTDFLDRTATSVYERNTYQYDDDFANQNAQDSTACAALRAKVKAGEPDDGDYTSEWAARDWSSDAGKVTAAVLMVQGQNDVTVGADNVDRYWSGLPASTPKKLWLSEVGHVDPFDFRRAVWVDTLHRWFDRFLLRIDNGIDRSAQLSVERSPDHWADYSSFPAAGSTGVTLSAVQSSSGPALATGPGANGTVALTKAHQTVNVLTPALTAPLRISGTPSATVVVSSSISQSASISVDDTVEVDAELYDVGPATIRGSSYRMEPGVLDPTTTRSCWGESGHGDSACFYDTPPDVATVQQTLLSYGARSLFHHSSVTEEQSVQAGKQYTLSIPGWTMDRVLAVGHRLELQVAAYGPAGSVTTVHLAGTSVLVPVVGGSVRLGS